MIETKDLILRQAVQEDWYCMYHNIWKHPESAKYMFWSISDSEEAAYSRMQRTIAWQQSHEHHWTVVEKSSGQAIGWAGFELLPDGSCSETGIAIGPAFVRRGYGGQILNAMTDCAKNELGAKRFLCSYREKNIASWKLQESCGFHICRREERTDPRSGEPFIMVHTEKEL